MIGNTDEHEAATRDIRFKRSLVERLILDT